MAEREHLIYFSSDFSTQDRVSGGFIINLPFVLNLEGEWKCAVLDFFIRTDNTDTHSSQFIYILADFCETSIILQTKEISILRKIHLNTSVQYYDFANPLYIRLKQNSLTDFELVFLNSFLLPIILTKPSKIECLLHFIKDE